MNADLVLEGGGVKGIGLVGAISTLRDAGYEFPRVAGTSAGAIAGALVAAGMSPDRMREIMEELDYRQFRDKGLLDRFGYVGKALSLAFEKGIYEGNYLRSWLDERLAELGVHTFGDLRIEDDPEISLPPEQAYRLVVMVADITRGRLVRLPWDYSLYGLEPDEQRVSDAVRASMSIPYFYEPVKLTDSATKETCYLVDGGLLSNFPIAVFDRRDDRPPRWPTLGIKLSARPESMAIARHQFKGPLGFGAAVVGTAVSAHDYMHLDDECVVERTIFVDSGTVKATDFDLDLATQKVLFENGVEAAHGFLAGWDFDTYVARCRQGQPREDAYRSPASA